MQEELASARAAAVSGDRPAAVVHAHKGLENDLAGFEAALALIAKGQAQCGDFDPWAELNGAVRRVDADVAVCLRLFNPRRAVASTKGMATAEALYRPKKTPPARFEDFAAVVRRALSGNLSPAATLSVAACLQKVDVEAARRLIAVSVQECLADTEEPAAAGTAPDPARVRRTVIGDPAAVQRSLAALLALDIDCCVQPSAGPAPPRSLMAEHSAALGRLVPPHIAEDLRGYEQVRTRELPQRRARLEERAREKAEQTRQQQRQQSEAKKAATVAKSSAAGPLSASAALAATGAGPRTLTETLTNPLNTAGWKLHASRAVAVVAALFLLRLLVRLMPGLLRHLGGLLGRSQAQSRRRTLTF